MERSIVINAPAEKVFTQVNSFKNFNEWSPWASIDPNTEYTYEGPETGVGARMTWVSDDPNVGTGSQEIMVSEAYSKITNKMVFDGFNSETSASYIFEPEGDGTKVTWTYDATGAAGIERFFMLGMDGMLGPFYEQGLNSLKTLVENMPDPEPEPEMEVPMDSTAVEADTTAAQ